jgi:hypothetical protein
MKTFNEWLELREISSNLLNRAADAAAARGDMKGDRLQSKFLQGSEDAAERARGLPRAASWVSGGIEAGHPNSDLIPNYSGIKYFFRGEGGKTEEGSFVIRNIQYNPSYGDWFQKERGAAWARTHDGDGNYNKTDDSKVTGRMPDYRELYEIETTKGEKVTVDGMAEAATLWQMGEAPRILNHDNRLQVKLNGKDVFPDRNGAAELARQINKYDYEQVLAKAKTHQLRSSGKVEKPSDFKNRIKPEFIKQG